MDEVKEDFILLEGNLIILKNLKEKLSGKISLNGWLFLVQTYRKLRPRLKKF